MVAVINARRAVDNTKQTGTENKKERKKIDNKKSNRPLDEKRNNEPGAGVCCSWLWQLVFVFALRGDSSRIKGSETPNNPILNFP